MVVTARRTILMFTLTIVAAGCALPPVEGRLADTQPAETELKLAIAAAPFPLRLPAVPPEGFGLAHVEWIDEPDDPVRHGFSFDARYVGPDNAVIHIFQTNVSPFDMGETDPVRLSDAAPVSIAGADWSAITLPNGDGSFNTQIARRFDGTDLTELITLTIDAPSAELATAAAKSLVEVSP
ncbi:MAG TPA: hypothetical protein VFU44_07245 [Candidatus Limnocylindria bacterium]|jgi:hypothetical protein|nr:hypothetical protein [Candidatus Limnocylindria bacterium]